MWEERGIGLVKKKERVYKYKLSKKIIEKLLRDFITINKAYS